MTAPLVASCLFVAGCSLGQFDELRDRAWADATDAPDGMGSDYPIALAALTTDLPGLHAVGVSAAPAGLATISYSISGSIDSLGVALDPAFADQRPIVVAATDPVVGADGAVAVGGLGASNTILLYDARTGTEGPMLRRVIDGRACGGGLTAFAEHMVYTPTAVGDPDQPDLVVSAGTELIVYPDLTPASVPTCFRCTISPMGGARPIRSIVAVGLSEAPGNEIIIAVDSGVIAFDTTWIEANDQTSCNVVQTGLLGDIPLGEASLELGKAMAVGDEEPIHKLAIWAPASGRVFVYRGLGRSGPVSAANITSVIVDAASPSFGSSLAFADLDRDGVDELVVGDPGATVDNVAEAGRATVFKLNAADPFEYERLVDLHDARPDAKQRLGRAITTAEFVGSSDDADTLVIGASFEVFTYFQALATGTDPRE